MPNGSASVAHATTGASTPRIHLSPGELASQLSLIPPIVPVPAARRDKPKPFFAACAATPCDSMAEKAVFMAYAALAGPTGATWDIKRNRVRFFSRQAKVATIAGCSVRTVYKMTLRLLQAGRLRCVLSGRGRIPHAFVVVPEGWNSQFRPERGADLNSVDRNVVPINRAFSSKRRAANATRLEEEKPSPVTNQPRAKKAASDVPSQAEQTQPAGRPSLSLVEPRPEETTEGRLKRWWADEKAKHGPKTAKQQTAIQPEPTPELTAEPTPERRAAALALFAAVDAGIDTAAEVAMLQKRHDAISQRRGGADRGGCPKCASDRLIGGSCNVCGYDDGSEPRPLDDCNAGGDR